MTLCYNLPDNIFNDFSLIMYNQPLHCSNKECATQRYCVNLPIGSAAGCNAWILGCVPDHVLNFTLS